MNQEHHIHADPAEQPGGHGGHGLMMMACCIPMLVIAVALLATGVVGPSFLIIAVGCTAMMYFMMRGMPGSDKAGGHGHQ